MLSNSLAMGGAEKVVATLALEFARRGWQPHVLCLERGPDRSFGDLPVRYLSVDPTGASTLRKILALVPLARKLKNYVREHKITLVQSHIYRANYVNVLARLLGSGHLVQLVNHGMPSQYRRQGFKGVINQWLIRRLYPKSDQVICPSQAMSEELMQLGVNSATTSWIPNPVDLKAVSQRAVEPIDHPLLSDDSGKRYFIAIGRLEPVKRVTDIVTGFARISATHPGIDLVILGTGSQREMLEEQLVRNGLERRVHLLGRESNPYPFIARATGLISASESEGFSLVIVYALALGVPVIATDCPGGPREILAPGSAKGESRGGIEQAEFGLLVPVGDTASLGEAMHKVAADETLALNYRAMGPKRARDFDLQKVADAYQAQMSVLAGS